MKFICIIMRNERSCGCVLKCREKAIVYSLINDKQCIKFSLLVITTESLLSLVVFRPAFKLLLQK